MYVLKYNFNFWRKENVRRHHILNIMVKWLSLLLCIQEVLSLNLGPEASYPD
jgi:hypothetical protein